MIQPTPAPAVHSGALCQLTRTHAARLMKIPARRQSMGRRGGRAGAPGAGVFYQRKPGGCIAGAQRGEGHPKPCHECARPLQPPYTLLVYALCELQPVHRWRSSRADVRIPLCQLSPVQCKVETIVLPRVLPRDKGELRACTCTCVGVKVALRVDYCACNLGCTHCWWLLLDVRRCVVVFFFFFMCYERVVLNGSDRRWKRGKCGRSVHCWSVGFPFLFCYCVGVSSEVVCIRGMWLRVVPIFKDYQKFREFYLLPWWVEWRLWFCRVTRHF